MPAVVKAATWSLLRPTIWRAVAQALSVPQLELLAPTLTAADPRSLPQTTGVEA